MRKQLFSTPQVWLHLGISHAFSCPARHCHVFSPRLDPLDNSCPEIVPREAWFARPPTAPNKRFPAQPIYGVIVGAGCPVFGCFTKTSCSSIMRIFQNYHIDGRDWKDIGYNFVIGSDGRVYEGVGWSNQSQHPPISYMSQSMLLAFVGRFQIRAPNADSMRAARQLLKCLQHRKKINPRYQLQPLSYFTPNYPWPGKELKELLVNWNHFQVWSLAISEYLSQGYFSFCMDKLHVRTKGRKLETPDDRHAIRNTHTRSFTFAGYHLHCSVVSIGFFTSISSLWDHTLLRCNLFDCHPCLSLCQLLATQQLVPSPEKRSSQSVTDCGKRGRL